MSIRPRALLLAVLIVAATAAPANPLALSSDQLERLARREIVVLDALPAGAPPAARPGGTARAPGRAAPAPPGAPPAAARWGAPALALVKAAPDTVWGVLVDYPRHSGLYPNVVEATVLEVDAAHALVRYVGVGPFSFGFHVNNYPDAARGRLAWRLDRGRKNGLFRESVGYWQLEPRGGGGLLTYAMAARTVLPRFLTAGAERDGMVEAIRAVRDRAEQRR